MRERSRSVSVGTWPLSVFWAGDTPDPKSQRVFPFHKSNCHTHTHFLIVLWFVSLERKVFFSEIEKIHTFRRFTGAGRSRINRGANGDAVIVPADIFVWKLCLKCERLSWPLSPCLIHRTSLCHCQRERVRIWVREFRLFTAKTRDEAFQ